MSLYLIHDALFYCENTEYLLMSKNPLRNSFVTSLALLGNCVFLYIIWFNLELVRNAKLCTKS